MRHGAFSPARTRRIGPEGAIRYSRPMFVSPRDCPEISMGAGPFGECFS